MTPFGIEVSREHVSQDGTDGLGHRFLHPIQDLEDDYGKFGKSIYRVNRDSTLKRMDEAGELFGDILPPKLSGGGLYSGPTQFLVHCMGMENLYISMYDYPDKLHEIMRRFAEDTTEYFRFLETEGLLLPTAAGEGVAQGSFAFTDELPQTAENRPLVSTDLWGYIDSQESVGISPEMYAQFIFPYYKLITDQFGLLSYGCCEPVHDFWDDCLSKLDNLRKISISPWCDEQFMAERLRGRKVIYHRKPSPNYIGGGTKPDETAFREYIRKTVKLTSGMPLEIAQRDVYTVNSDENAVRRYVEIIREEIENHW